MKKGMRKAVATLDAVIAIALIGLVFTAYTYMQKGQKIVQTHIDEQKFLQGFDTGILKAFEDIVDAYTPQLIPTADTDTTWGWNKLNTVSPFPSYVTVGGVPYLAFDLDENSIGTTAFTQLKRSIISDFRDACKDGSSTAGSGNVLYLYCENLRGLQYQISTGTVNRATALGNPIDPSDVPVAIVSFAKRDGAGTEFRTDTYDVSYDGIYQKRQVQTANKLNEMRAAFESFTNATKLREIANVENSDKSGGLNSADDEFVGWHWKVFGDDFSLIQSTYCNKAAGGGVCSNLDTSNIWRSGTGIARGLVARRFNTNLMAGDASYFNDAFGNGIYIYPTLSQCAGGSDYMACNIDALTVPQDDYITIGMPPYVSVFYTEPFAQKATAGQPYGRVLVAY